MWKGSKNRWKVDTVLEDAQVIGVGKDSTWKCKPLRTYVHSFGPQNREVRDHGKWKIVPILQSKI